MHVRSYGSSGDLVIVLHGGPGACGYMAPVALGLSDSFRVLEPFQRASGDGALTVGRHVQDLHELIESRCAGTLPALVGHSWGAMLALAYSAAHPGLARALVLVGCGTFDSAARRQMQATVEDRMSVSLRRCLRQLPDEFPDPDERLQAAGDLLAPTYSFQLDATALGTESCDALAYQQTWQDMLRLQEEGVYPAGFRRVTSPVLMLHGAHDPHPGRLVRASLEPYLPQLEYQELERCGHYPWLERTARARFFAVLREWLTRQ
ncbi:MAG TPA: alpha/beta hydrolase [Candidatus Binataceae bacterium]